MLNNQKILDFNWLSREQKLLVQACVFQGQDAINAWRKWQYCVDIENLDSASILLLSQLYRNLLIHQVADFQMGRLKGIYKRNWLVNRLLFKKLEIILQSFESYKIPTILLGDSAIVAGYYKDLGDRTIYGISLLVHPIDGAKALSLLKDLGWNQTHQSQFILNEKNLIVHLEDESKTKLHLQGHIFWATPQEYTEKQIWNNAIYVSIENIKTFILSPTDLFLYYCVACFYWNKNQHINLLTDAVSILQSQNEVDWKQLVIKAQRYQITLPLKNMIILLQDLFQLSIPESVILDLDRGIEKYQAIMDKLSKTKYASLFREKYASEVDN